MGVYFGKKSDLPGDLGEPDISLDAVRDLNSDILDNSRKSYHILSLMDRLVEKLDTDDIEDKLETLDSYLTLLDVVRGLVAEIRERSEEVEHTADLLQRKRADASTAYLTLSACTHCTLGIEAGHLPH